MRLIFIFLCFLGFHLNASQCLSVAGIIDKSTSKGFILKTNPNTRSEQKYFIQLGSERLLLEDVAVRFPVRRKKISDTQFELKTNSQRIQVIPAKVANKRLMSPAFRKKKDSLCKNI